MSDIYFVNEIQDNIENNNNYIYLFKYNEYDDLIVEDNENFPKLEIRPINKIHLKSLNEGTYIYNNLASAYKDKRVQKILNNNNYLRSKLYKKYKFKDASNFIYNNINNVHSYHINVGHGNCSIIVFNSDIGTKIWMIDCSLYDISINHKNTNSPSCTDYTKNFNACVNDIKNTFKISNFTIDKFFLTHSHYDHFSGVIKLIKENIINNKTDVWINLYYSWPHNKYNVMLKKLDEINCNLFEPITRNGNSIMNILHPYNRMYRNIPQNNKHMYCVAKKINNSSVIYEFILNNKNIIFPGDIEKLFCDSHKCIIKYLTFYNFIHYLKHINYYCVAHHGSINGHELYCNIFHYAKFKVSNLKIDNAIIMAKDGAHKGIISKNVINDFNNILYRTDACISNGNPVKFIKIDWTSNNINYI